MTLDLPPFELCPHDKIGRERGNRVGGARCCASPDLAQRCNRAHCRYSATLPYQVRALKGASPPSGVFLFQSTDQPILSPDSRIGSIIVDVRSAPRSD